MDVVQSAWFILIFSSGLQFLMAIIAIAAGFKTSPTIRTDLEEGTGGEK